MEQLSSSVCRSCRIRLNVHTARAFSTSTRRQIVPPESPAYIDVPSSLQAGLPLRKREKGVLPVPRELFPARRPDKPSKLYLDNLTKSPLAKNEVPYESLTEHGKYRHRMAQLRKKHVREGLTELHKRKVETISKMEHRSREKQTERDRLLSQPPREDARLTNNTVPQAMQPTKSATPIADDLAAAKALYEKKIANYNAHVAAKAEERLDALHTLYMNARDFITTEKDLDEEIERQFDPDLMFKSSSSEGKSMWNKGPPDTIKDMITGSQMQDSGSRAMLSAITGKHAPGNRARFIRDQERMKMIAERLSGGKI